MGLNNSQYARRHKRVEIEKGVTERGESTYKYNYKWQRDYTLLVYPLWVVANNQMLHPELVNKLASS